MGTKLSIDKHVSNLEDLLEMSPAYFSKLKFENKIPDCITQHIKIWRYYEEDKKTRNIKSQPISLQNIQNSSFNFSSNECYLVLFVYKKGTEDLESFVNFPHSMWGVVESYSNLTPRGLEVPISSSESLSSLNKEVLESFLLPKRINKKDDGKYEYMIFVWNGKGSNPLVKSMALSAAFDLDTLITKAKDPLLQVLFSGGVIRNKKLQKGTILQLNSNVNKEETNDTSQKLYDIRETIYLFKFLFPQIDSQQGRLFNQRFLQSSTTASDSYIQIGEFDEDDQENENMHPNYVPNDEQQEPEYYEESPINNNNQQYSSDRRSPRFNRDEEESYEQQQPQYSDSPQDRRNEQVNLSKNQVIPKLSIEVAQKGGGTGTSSSRNREESGAKQQQQKSKVPGLSLGGINNENSQPESGKQFNVDLNSKDYPSSSEDYEQSPHYQEKPASNNRMGLGLNLGALNQQNQAPHHQGGGGGEDSREQQQQQYSPDEEVSQDIYYGEDPDGNNGPISRDEEFGPQESERDFINENQQKNNMPINFENLNKNLNKPQNYEELQERLAAGETLEEIDLSEAELKKYKLEYFSKLCSAVLENQLYVGGETIAYNRELLEEIGVTHIINAAGDICANKFPDKFEYLTYYLKDSKAENIECVFYEVIFYIEKAINEGGRVLVHCVQGVSRSVTMCIAYLMFKYKYTYEEGYNKLRETRAVASPNLGFIVQLFNFYKRLYQDFNSLPSPRIFGIGSHQDETPQYLVARMLLETFYDQKNNKGLDPRGVFIIQTQEQLILWIGNEVLEANYERYIQKAHEQIELLQKYEHAVQDVQVIKAGEENQDFWNMMGRKEGENKYFKVKEWDKWYVDLSSKQNVQGPTIDENNEEEEEAYQANNAYSRPLLYSFPELDPTHNIDFENLIDHTNLLVLCTERQGAKKAFIWRGTGVPSDIDENDYLAQVLKHKWPEENFDMIQTVYEVPEEESDEFVSYFDG